MRVIRGPWDRFLVSIWYTGKVHIYDAGLGAHVFSDIDGEYHAVYRDSPIIGVNCSRPGLHIHMGIPAVTL